MKSLGKIIRSVQAFGREDDVRDVATSVVDDLLATGGTALATTKLVESLGGKVASLAFIVELDFLKGRDKLAGYEVVSMLHYDK